MHIQLTDEQFRRWLERAHPPQVPQAPLAPAVGCQCPPYQVGDFPTAFCPIHNSGTYRIVSPWVQSPGPFTMGGTL